MFLLECWRNCSNPTARIWASSSSRLGADDDGVSKAAGVGMGEGMLSSEGGEGAGGVGGGGGGGERESKKMQVPRKHFMRGRMPFRDKKARDSLVGQHELAGFRAVVTALARRESFLCCLSVSVCICLCLCLSASVFVSLPLPVPVPLLSSSLSL